MKPENVRMALIESMACDIEYRKYEPKYQDHIPGIIEVGQRLGFDAAELRAAAHALAATPHKINPLMTETMREMKGKYA